MRRRKASHTTAFLFVLKTFIIIVVAVVIIIIIIIILIIIIIIIIIIMASSSFSTWVRQRFVCERASGSLLTARAGTGSETLPRSNPPLKGHAIPQRTSAHLWEKTYPVFAHELPI